MSAKSSFAEAVDWQEQAHQYLVQGQYSQAASLYEQAIATEPEVKCHYWHLGLLLLLQEQEAEAQLTWLLAMEGEPEQVDLWTVELVQVLQTEAQRREALADYSVAWAIRQHIREISPSDINNLLLRSLPTPEQTHHPQKISTTFCLVLLQRHVLCRFHQ